ncbi:hypothetical protein ACOSQ2_018257 [Xanthoceras sorbifolium]
MKKQHSATMTGCFLFFVSFFVLESNLTILSNFRVSTSTASTPPAPGHDWNLNDK